MVAGSNPAGGAVIVGRRAQEGGQIRIQPGPDTGSEPFEVVGSDVVLPGSEQLAPVVFGLLAVASISAAVVTLLVRRRRSRRGIRRRPVVLAIVSTVALVAVGATVVTWPPAFDTPEFPPTGPLFPDEGFFTRPIDDLEVARESDRWTAALGDLPLFANFGGPPRGVVWGVPFNPVDESTPTTRIRYRAPWSRYEGPVPIADPAYIESMPTYGFDNHYVALDRERRMMWELLGATVWFGRWEADSGAFWDLDSLDYGEYSTTASGLPLLPGLVTYDEVAGGSLEHVIWAGSPGISSTRHLWPARATDGRSDDPDAPPMGAWFRLRADADLSGLGPQAKVIARALQRHGVMLTDTSGGVFSLRGTPDGRFDLDDLRGLRRFTPADFDAVDHEWLMVDADSMAARPR